jgi:hypothetical protein
LGKNDPLKFLSLKSRIKDMCIWLESEKFRADLFKTAGLAFCSPCSVIIFYFLTNTEHLINRLGMTKLIVIALMLIIGIGLLIKGYEVLIDLDKRIEKNA